MAIPITITRMPRPLFSAGVANYIWVTFATSSGSAEKNDVVISDVRPFVQPTRPVPGGISELACGGIPVMLEYRVVCSVDRQSLSKLFTVAKSG